jgi:hypothetical protein
MTGNNHSDSGHEFLHTLGLAPPCSVEDVKEAYRIKVKVAHPDAGGSVAEFNAVQQAFEQSMQYVRFRAGRMTWLSSHVEQYAAQQAMLLELEQHGAVAEIEEIDWLRKSFGADFAQLVDKIVGLALRGRQFGDDTIAYLLSERQTMEHVRWLDLSTSQVTDRGARLLGVFENLRRLDLRGTAITSSSLRLVELLPKLEWIGLPPAALGLTARLKFRWQRPDLQFARSGEACAPNSDQH